MNPDDLDQQLTGLAGLGDPLRRALYRHVAERGVPVSRDEAAAAVGISRPLAAYHLDKLLHDGLLEPRYQRRSGRRGPGAGRPAKHYVRATGPIELSLPARDYATLAELLAAAVEADLAAKDEQALVARTTDAWLITLRENLAGMEQDTEEAFGAGRELAKLLVEGITVSRDEDSRPRVEIIYRSGPPEPGPGQAVGESALSEQYSEEFAKAHARGGTQGLLRGHPKMSSYEVAVQRVGSGGE